MAALKASTSAKSLRLTTAVGTFAPPFRPLTPEEDAEIVRTINDAAPDIVWIGLSTPKQEQWMADHRGRLTAPVLIGEYPLTTCM